MENMTCPSCKLSLPPDAHFCPNCGYKLSAEVTLAQQISLYTLSLLLPPFGLFPAIKLLRQPNQKAKQVGIIAIVLNVLSFSLSMYFILSFFSQYASTINQIETMSQLGM